MWAYWKQLLQIRGVKLSLEIGLVMVLFFSIKLYQQRDLVSGAPPSLNATLLDGQAVSMQAYQGKPLLLHFWATWCKICKLEENGISEASKDYQVLTIAMNSGPEVEIEQYLQQHKLSFPVIVDEQGIIAKRFGVHVVPTSFVLDSSGKIAFTEVGLTSIWGLKIRLWLAQD